MTTTQELDQLQKQFAALLDKTSGRQREIAAASLREIEACKLELLADAMQALGQTTEAARARLTARIAHAQANKVLETVQ